MTEIKNIGPENKKKRNELRLKNLANKINDSFNALPEEAKYEDTLINHKEDLEFMLEIVNEYCPSKLIQFEIIDGDMLLKDYIERTIERLEYELDHLYVRSPSSSSNSNPVQED